MEKDKSWLLMREDPSRCILCGKRKAANGFHVCATCAMSDRFDYLDKMVDNCELCNRIIGCGGER